MAVKNLCGYMDQVWQASSASGIYQPLRQHYTPNCLELICRVLARVGQVSPSPAWNRWWYMMWGKSNHHFCGLISPVWQASSDIYQSGRQHYTLKRQELICGFLDRVSQASPSIPLEKQMGLYDVRMDNHHFWGLSKALVGAWARLDKLLMASTNLQASR